MEEKSLNEIIRELELSESIELSSIPNIDLYMDQVITLFEDKLTHTKRNKADKLLTKTMINNYTKDKLLMPAAKKKYTKEHIILMILLYELKHILTIGDIKELFRVIIKDDKVDAKKLSSIYQTYLNSKIRAIETFETSVEATTKALKEEISKMDLANDKQIENMLLAIMLTEKATYYKRLAEKIIDEKIGARE
ncbi:DUF1836 domain-containing protein [Cellulosilyticum sp. I15G10I2]|uniref:DUF1836 domain-containing protein n=1 Tax=Cellulosilyticum sp. I15G10I2 TaxID=1892843 RepID=UPI00085BBF58|nr:DUF1836 domain-containing protein [Cellulosilyticum sp. I15G10I2]